MLLLALVGVACIVQPMVPPGAEDTSGTTDAAEASTGPGASATSVTTGLPPETSSSTSGDTSDETGITFIMGADGGCGVTEDGYWHCWECGVDVQDCADGYKCVPWANDGGEAWNAHRCSPIPDAPAGLGETCVAEGSPVSGLDDCDVGALCWEVDPRTLQGTCVALCFDDGLGSCGDGMDCAYYDGFSPSVCLSRCDPLDPATCPADEVCRDLGREAMCVPSVVLPQGLSCGPVGEYCTPDQACTWAEWLASCVDSECCTAWCDLSAPDPDLACAAVPGEACRPFFAQPLPGYEHVGVCGVPPGAARAAGREPEVS
jgi:hypothetical protein